MTKVKAQPVFRTANGVLAPKGDLYWGVTVHEVENPDASEIPEGMLDAIRLPTDFVKMPNEQWGAQLDLYDYVLDWDTNTSDRRVGETCEAMVIFLRGNGKDHARSEWMPLAPTTEVGGAYADYDFTKPLVNILTGERFKSLASALSKGWVHSGDSHSHGYLGSFHSATDDKDDLHQPGIHMVVGNVAKDGGCAAGYDMTISVVRNGRRYFNIIDPETNQPRPFDLSDIVEGDTNVITPFHKKVLKVVTKGKARSYKAKVKVAGGSMGSLFSQGWESLPGAYCGGLGRSEWDALVDALKAAYPAIYPLLDIIADWDQGDGADVLRALNDASVLEGLTAASRGGGLDV